MDVRMVMQVLAPAVQYGDEADLGAQVRGSAAILRRVSDAALSRMA